eukprot:m.52071 g.52071  ORF g.52071 m.52071 type:complete len:762 (-) comp6349_c0_seq2:154-2439(-)
MSLAALSALSCHFPPSMESSINAPRLGGLSENIAESAPDHSCKQDVYNLVLAYSDYWRNPSARRECETAPFSFEDVRPLLERAATIVVAIRGELDELGPSKTRRRIDGAAQEYLLSLKSRQPSKDPDRFVRNIVHATLRDTHGYVEGLTLDRVDALIAKHDPATAADGTSTARIAKLLDDIGLAWGRACATVGILTATERKHLIDNFTRWDIAKLEQLVSDLKGLSRHTALCNTAGAASLSPPHTRHKRKNRGPGSAREQPSAFTRVEESPHEGTQRDTLGELWGPEDADLGIVREGGGAPQPQPSRLSAPASAPPPTYAAMQAGPESSDQASQAQQQSSRQQTQQQPQQGLQQQHSIGEDSQSDDLQPGVAAGQLTSPSEPFDIAVKQAEMNMATIHKEIAALMHVMSEPSTEKSLLAQPEAGENLVYELLNRCELFMDTLAGDMTAIKQAGLPGNLAATEIHHLENAAEEVVQTTRRLARLGLQLERIRRGRISKAEGGAQTALTSGPEESHLSLDDSAEMSVADLDRFETELLGEMRDWFRTLRLEPRIDIHDEDDKYVVQTFVPGLRREDVEIHISDGVLLLKGFRGPANEALEAMAGQIPRPPTKEALLRLGAGKYGTFAEMFRLPGDVDAPHAVGAYERGVLTVSLPKTRAVKPSGTSALQHGAHAFLQSPFEGKASARRLLQPHTPVGQPSRPLVTADPRSLGLFGPGKGRVEEKSPVPPQEGSVIFVDPKTGTAFCVPPESVMSFLRSQATSS